MFLFNDSENYGGSEVYTHFFAQALLRAGHHVVLLVLPTAHFWQRMDLSGLTVHPVRSCDEVESEVGPNELLICHNGPPIEWLERLRQRGNVIVMAHNPPTPAHQHEYYAPANLLFAVSEYVLNCCHRYGYTQTYPTPLLGVGEITRGIMHEPIQANERYVWETRKGRDWLMSKVYPAFLRLRPRRRFIRQQGLTIGVVSRIAQIKQFHLLFRPIAGVLEKHPEIRIEIFGSGKYKLVNQVERALAPLGRRVRYWGWQWDVAAIYPNLDYVIAGLPEREALGLNVIEAQFCGTPVLAVNAPPFTETIVDGQTGFLFRDPREDDGADFDRVITNIIRQNLRPDPRLATSHLDRFKFDAFADRVQKAIEYAQRTLLNS